MVHMWDILQPAISKTQKNIGFPSMLRKSQDANLSNIFTNPWEQNNVVIVSLMEAVVDTLVKIGALLCSEERIKV